MLSRNRFCANLWLSLSVAAGILSGSAGATTLLIGGADFAVSTSTTTDSGFFNGLDPSPSSAPALPGDGTFTLPFAGNNGLLGLQGKFFKKTWDLPSDASGVSLSLELRSNDEMAVYLNGTVVAIQADTALVPNPILTYQFTLDSSDTTTESSSGGPAWDTDLWDYLSMSQSLFQVGANELTIYATDTCCVGSGQPGGGSLSTVLGLAGFGSRRRLRSRT